jgi:hypothetical protein
MLEEAQFFGAVLILCNDAVLNTQVSRDLSDVSMPVLDRDTRLKHVLYPIMQISSITATLTCSVFLCFIKVLW